MNHRYHYHLPEGIYAAAGYGHAESARPKVDARKDGAGASEGRSACPGCGRGIYREDDGQPTPSGDAKTVGQVDRPNGIGITVTLPDGTVVKAPYGQATIFTCPSCNLKPEQRAKVIDRIRQAHYARIRQVGERVG